MEAGPGQVLEKFGGKSGAAVGSRLILVAVILCFFAESFINKLGGLCTGLLDLHSTIKNQALRTIVHSAAKQQSLNARGTETVAVVNAASNTRTVY